MNPNNLNHNTAIRNGDIYCSTWCGAKCTHKAYLKAVEDADELKKECEETIGGVWYTNVNENLGWHFGVVNSAGITINESRHSDINEKYRVGIYGGTPVSIFVENLFISAKEAYYAQLELIEQEEKKWSELLTKAKQNLI